MLGPVLPVFGDPRLPPRFWAKVRVDETTGCWIWIASLNRGYGQISVGGRPVKAYRHAYLTLVGPVPEGLELDHVKARGCVGPVCCNPAHLEPVTHRVNMLRGNGVASLHAMVTHCPKGHPYDEANTYVRNGRRHQRLCRACRRALWTTYVRPSRRKAVAKEVGDGDRG
jgi:hypothetical protein